MGAGSTGLTLQTGDYVQLDAITTLVTDYRAKEHDKSTFACTTERCLIINTCDAHAIVQQSSYIIHDIRHSRVLNTMLIQVTRGRL